MKTDLSRFRWVIVAVIGLTAAVLLGTAWWTQSILVDNQYSSVTVSLNKFVVLAELIRYGEWGKGFLVSFGSPSNQEDWDFVTSFQNIPYQFVSRLDYLPEKRSYIYKVFFRSEQELDSLVENSKQLSDDLSRDLRERAFQNHQFAGEELISITAYE